MTRAGHVAKQVSMKGTTIIFVSYENADFRVLCCRVFVFCPFSCEKKRYLYYSVDSFTRR